MERGEIYRVHKPGGDAKKHRLFVVVSRQVLIDSKFSTVICAPVFSSGQALSTQVAIGPDQGMKHPSWIMCDNLVSLRKTELSHYVVQLPTAKIAELDRALRMALAL
jgi:mRNA interferase MazF